MQHTNARQTHETSFQSHKSITQTKFPTKGKILTRSVAGGWRFPRWVPRKEGRRGRFHSWPRQRTDRRLTSSPGTAELCDGSSSSPFRLPTLCSDWKSFPMSSCEETERSGQSSVTVKMEKMRFAAFMPPNTQAVCFYTEIKTDLKVYKFLPITTLFQEKIIEKWSTASIKIRCKSYTSCNLQCSSSAQHTQIVHYERHFHGELKQKPTDSQS